MWHLTSCSFNFQVETLMDPSYWTLKGAAMLTMLNDWGRKPVTSPNATKNARKNSWLFKHPGFGICWHFSVIYCWSKKKTRWSPRTRMPTRMLRNRDNTYLSHIPTSPLVGHPDLTHWGDTLVGHPCLTLLRNALVKHFYLTLLWDTLAWQFFWGTLTWHSCRTLLTWHFLLDTLTWGSCKTFLLDTSYLTLLWDTLTWHFLLEILTWHSCRTLLPDTLVRHSYLTLL